MRDAVALRSAIGLASQYAAVDELLTGRENLKLYHPGRAERRRRHHHPADHQCWRKSTGLPTRSEAPA